MKTEEAQLNISLHTPTVHRTLMKNGPRTMHGDLLHAGRVITPQSFEKADISIVMSFTLQ